MSKKEIERLDEKIDHTHNLASAITIVSVIAIALGFVLFVGIFQDKSNSEWQCTQWKETDELVDCVERTDIEYRDTHREWDKLIPNYDNLCEKQFGQGFEHAKDITRYYSNPAPDVDFFTCSKSIIEIKCEHKKVCVQEMLVRDAR